MRLRRQAPVGIIEIVRNIDGQSLCLRRISDFFPYLFALNLDFIMRVDVAP